MQLRPAKNRRARALGLVTVLVAAAIVGGVPTATAQGGNDTLVIAMQKDVGNYNFFDLASNTVWKANVVEGFWDSLAGLDTNGDVYPWLAESWTTISDDPASADYLKVKVTLRPDVKFSDGKPLTAEDVVFSFVALRHPGTTFSSFIVSAFDADDDGLASKAEVENGVKKLDDRTIQFTLAKKYGQFYKTTLGVPVVPKHIWSEHLKADQDCPVCLDTQWSDPAALVGSGPWKFKEGVRDSRYVIERNDLYWGKTFLTPNGKHPVWSKHVRTVQFDIYSSLESAILAVRSGKVDHIPWSITPGHIPSLASDPAAKLNFISENGYFYLAFNEKREPMNDLAFRQAMSHLIDKRTIVDVYMGGFGQAGDSHLPPFWSEWYNASVRHYEFSPEKAKGILKNAGYKGAALGNHESRTLLRPDGSAMPSIVILTPPADYDPIRIKSGEFVAKQMRELGIDATAKAIDFNTLVGRMNGFDYQMLIIGWQLSSDPVSNICEIMGARATQNFFGFWDPHTAGLDNPAYANVGGVSSKADAPSRALVAKVEAACKTARESFDPAVQVKAIKDAQGYLSEAVPANVLYYRTNAYATSSAWNGWVTFLGKLHNMYSLAAVHRGTIAPVTAEPEDLLLAVEAPAQIPVGAEREVRVVALKANGLPASGAQISAHVAGGSVQALSGAGTANSDGVWTFNLRGKEDGYSSLYVNASKATRSASATVPVAGVASAPPLLFVEGKPGKSFLNPGESTHVTYTVRDRAGTPVKGALVKVDQNLLQWGTATLPAASDDSGRTTLLYTAPAATAVPSNRHLEVGLTAHAEKAGFRTISGNSLTLPLLVRGGSEHDWGVVSIVSASRWAAETANRDVTLLVDYKDPSGAALANHLLRLDVSRPGHLATWPATVTTDANGRATIPLTWTDGTASRAVTLRVRDAVSEDALSASATLLYKGTDGATGLYGGYLSWSAPALDPDAGSGITGTLRLYGLDGNPPSGTTPLAVASGSTPYGQLAGLAAGGAYTHSAVDDYSAIQVSTTADGQGFTSGGSFLGRLADAPTGPYPTWADLADAGYVSLDPGSMKAVNATDGVWTFTLDPQAAPLADRKSEITVVPMGQLGHVVTDDEINYYWTMKGETALVAEYAVWRTQKMLAVHWNTANPLLRTSGSGLTSAVTATAYDQDNNPVEGAAVKVYHNGLLPPSRWPFAATMGETNSEGRSTGTLSGETPAAYIKRNGPPNAFGRHDLFVSASKDGHTGLIGASHALLAPLATELRISSPGVRLADGAGPVTLQLTGLDETGAALTNWTVSLSALKGAFEGLTNGTLQLGSDGKASVTYKPPTPSVVPYVMDALRATAHKDLHHTAVASTTFVVVNAIPRITVLSPTADQILKLAAANVTGQVSDSDGLRSLQVRFDGGSFADVPIATGLTSSGFAHALRNLAPGEHSVTIRAIDQRGFVAEETVRFSVEQPPAPATERSFLERMTPGPAILAALGAVGAAAWALRRRDG